MMRPPSSKATPLTRKSLPAVRGATPATGSRPSSKAGSRPSSRGMPRTPGGTKRPMSSSLARRRKVKPLHAPDPPPKTVQWIKEEWAKQDPKIDYVTKGFLKVALEQFGFSKEHSVAYADGFFRLEDWENGRAPIEAFLNEFTRMQMFKGVQFILNFPEKFDTDGNQEICKEELMVVFTTMLGPDIAEDKVKQAFDQADVDHSGELSFEELHLWYQVDARKTTRRRDALAKKKEKEAAVKKAAQKAKEEQKAKEKKAAEEKARSYYAELQAKARAEKERKEQEEGVGKSHVANLHKAQQNLENHDHLFKSQY